MDTISHIDSPPGSLHGKLKQVPNFHIGWQMAYQDFTGGFDCTMQLPWSI